MTNDLLIDQLVHDLRPVRRQIPFQQAIILFVLAALELAGFLALGTMRPDMAGALGRAAFWWKISGLAALALLGVGIALRSFSPVERAGPGLRRWLYLLVGLILAGALIDAPGHSLAARLMWQMGIQCLCVASLLSIPPVIALGTMMRRGAPTNRLTSSLAVGAAAATWGAFIFAFHCPSDDPFYIVTWYSLSCCLVVGCARLILPTLTRW